MTSKDLLESLGQIDGRFVQEAEVCRPVAFPWLRVASLAACLCLVLLSLWCMAPLVDHPVGTVPGTTLSGMPEGFPEVVVQVQEMTGDGFVGIVAEPMVPELFEVGSTLHVQVLENTPFEGADGSCTSFADPQLDCTGCYVLVVCVGCAEGDAASVVADYVLEVPPPDTALQKG